MTARALRRRAVTAPRRFAPLLTALVAAVSLSCSTDDGTEQITIEQDAERRPTTSPPTAAPPAAENRGEEAIARDLFDRLNDERQERGLRPLAWDQQLAELAREWSDEMADLGTPQHRNLEQAVTEGEIEGFTGVGENVFGSTGPVPAGEAHVGWMRSSGHRANVLEPSWDRVGIGVTCTDDGAMYVTQNFGRSAVADTPPPDQTHDAPGEDPIAREERDGPTC